jgi:hypothetical protein
VKCHQVNDNRTLSALNDAGLSLKKGRPKS